MGRKTKFTKKTIEAIVTAVSIGASWTDAALAARVSDETIANWRKEGKQARASVEKGEKLDVNGRAKLDFLEQLEQAEAQCAIDMQILVYNSATKNPDDAKWWLERRRPEQFRPPAVRGEFGGKDGGPLVFRLTWGDTADGGDDGAGA